jgi:Rps23 Pro-64 3,4-dihydroxylase Tpa1-like proline 4-hydroxylase
MILKEKNIFTKDECDLILSYVDSNFKNWDNKDRKYNSLSIDYDTTNSWLFYRLKDFFEEQTSLKIKKLKKQLHFHKFTKGDWFSKHNDNRDRRMYGVGVLLNDDFIGGDFKFYNLEEYTLNKTKGNGYVFDVNIEHEITNILDGERYSLLWFLQNTDIEIIKKKFI